MAHPDFTSEKDVHLVPGSLFGLRAFSVSFSSLSRSTVLLRSPVQGDNWTPGENVADCSFRGFWDGHTPGQADCSCGMYSYFNLRSARTYFPETSPGIMAVIEAYGRVTLGNKGMRSEKARIVGLVTPKTLTGKLRHPLHAQVLEQFPDVRTFRTVRGAANAFGIHGRPKIKAAA